jgi:hypothetical protein
MEQPNAQEMAHVIDESLRRIEELERLLRQERLRFQSLVSGLLPLLLKPQPAKDLLDEARTISKDVGDRGCDPDHELHTGKRITRRGRVDGRSRFDPEKCLKISVARTLEWAKRNGKSAEAAHRRVLAAIQERAKHYGFGTVPESVRSYIDLAVREYE